VVPPRLLALVCTSIWCAGKGFFCAFLRKENMQNYEKYSQKLNTMFDKNDAFYDDRIVVKIGSSTIMSSSGEINHNLLNHVAWQTDQLMRDGYKIAILTSGAVACGRRILGFDTSASKQLLASIGQNDLEAAWHNAFRNYGRISGYSVFSENNLSSKVKIEDDHLLDAFDRGVVSIINGNDAVNEINNKRLMISQDNDMLAGFIARRVQAGRLILLTEADGVWDKEQKVMEEMTNWQDMYRMYIQEKTNEGTGGMQSKVAVALSFALNGRVAYIADGLKERAILDIIEGRSIGTRVLMAA
jgi:glutamate 5-kinase